MGAFLVILIPLAIVVLLWQVISPRSAWWALESWNYRKPEENEPSDAAYLMKRIVIIGLLIGLVWVFIDIASLNNDPPKRPTPTYLAPAP